MGNIYSVSAVSSCIPMWRGAGKKTDRKWTSTVSTIKSNAFKKDELNLRTENTKDLLFFLQNIFLFKL